MGLFGGMSLGEAVLQLAADGKQLEADLKKAKSQVGSAMQEMGAGITDVGGSLTKKVTLPILVGVGYLANAGRELAGITAGYENFAQQAGVDAGKMLGSMTTSAGGMLSNQDAMLAFNNAAGLVGTDFAKTLPGAMGVFNKVAAATGQNTSKVLSDYVTGVGRGSKMILDNLGITVNAVQANEDYAASIGKTAEELTDAEKKLALNEQAMGLLQEKYGEMEGVADLPGASMAQLGVILKDVRDLAAQFVVTGLGPMLKDIAALAAEWIPKLTEKLENMSPAQKENILKIIMMAAALGPLLVILGTLISSVGTVVGAMSAVAGVIGGPVLLVIGAVVAAVALLALAWKNDWGGIRTWMTKFWNDTLKPILQKIWEWLGVFVPAAIQVLADYWNNILKPAMQAVWGFVQDYLWPVFKALVDFFVAVFVVELKVLAGIWENVLWPALKKVWSFIAESLQPVFEALHDFWVNILKPALEKIDFIGKIRAAFDGVKVAIRWVIDKLQALKSKLDAFELPDWLQHNSPSPFEQTFLGAADAIRALARTELPKLQAELTGMSLGGYGAGAQGSGGAGGQQMVVVYGGLNLTGVEDRGGLLEALKGLA